MEKYSGGNLFINCSLSEELRSTQGRGNLTNIYHGDGSGCASGNASSFGNGDWKACMISHIRLYYRYKDDCMEDDCLLY